MWLSIAVIMRTTPRAIKVTLDDDGRAGNVIWIPKGSIEGGDELEAGERDIVLYVKGWWSREYEQSEYRRFIKDNPCSL